MRALTHTAWTAQDPQQQSNWSPTKQLIKATLFSHNRHYWNWSPCLKSQVDQMKDSFKKKNFLYIIGFPE